MFLAEFSMLLLNLSGYLMKRRIPMIEALGVWIICFVVGDQIIRLSFQASNMNEQPKIRLVIHD
jgi:hypothetical protein